MALFSGGVKKPLVCANPCPIFFLYVLCWNVFSEPFSMDYSESTWKCLYQSELAASVYKIALLRSTCLKLLSYYLHMMRQFLIGTLRDSVAGSCERHSFMSMGKRCQSLFSSKLPKSLQMIFFFFWRGEPFTLFHGECNNSPHDHCMPKFSISFIFTLTET